MKMILFKRIFWRVTALMLIFVSYWYAGVAYSQIDSWLLSRRVSEALNELRLTETGVFSEIDTGVHKAAQRALELTPEDADASMNAGLLWFYQGFSNQSRRERIKAFKEAIHYYEKAMSLRPVWPHHYRNLYELYYLTLRPVEDQWEMMRRVVSYGAWKREVKYFILERTLARPRSIPEDIRSFETELLNYLLSLEDRSVKSKMNEFNIRYPQSMIEAIGRVATGSEPN